MEEVHSPLRPSSIEIVSGVGQKPDVPKPTLTDSMVTIRLSVAESLIDPETFSQEKAVVSPDSEVHREIHVRGQEAAIYDEDQIIQSPDRDHMLHVADFNDESKTFNGSAVTSPFPDMVEDIMSEPESRSIRSRSDSTGSVSSGGYAQVDWDELDKNEEQEPRDEGSDESTAFLLARLDQANNALATDPKASITKAPRVRSKSRPPSFQQLKKLVNGPARSSLRYSMLPSPPPMTELEFWAALVTDYPQTAQRLPTLTSNKIRSGIPAPLRGVVWMSIAGSRDRFLEDEYERLCGESSPYEKLIGKDMGRTFPGVDMFRDPDGEGQKMLGNVLRCFSLWDQKIGYCQGLGFVVGPLLMHMGDKEAFCVLVRLMEHYDLRSCFLPDLSGLHLRIYQFQHLLSHHLPTLTGHLEKLQVEPLYLSQWFLSFFGVTCPLPMLLRIYDVILTEGASETLMRVALSLMRRNEKRILACTEFEDIMQLLLSRGLWDTYGCNADDLVNDFVGLTGLVTRESLQALEASFKEAQCEGSGTKISLVPDVQAAASKFLGRFWAGSSTYSKSVLHSPGLSAPSRPTSFLRRTPSKQSMASTLNSIESLESTASAGSTEGTTISRQSSADCTPVKKQSIPLARAVNTNKDKDLHGQIEDLLTALSDMQRDQTVLASELQREREEREEDRAVVQRTVDKLKNRHMLAAIPEDLLDRTPSETEFPRLPPDPSDILSELEDRFTVINSKRSSILQTKHQLREDVTRWKEQYNMEAARSTELSRQLTERESDCTQLKEQLRDARSRFQEGHREKQRLERSLQDMKSRRPTSSDPMPESPSLIVVDNVDLRASSGLREFKLGRSGSTPSQSMPVFSKRISSLSTQTILATEDHKPAAEDALLLELVNAKTAEAVARQELEEVKGKLDSLRKMLGGSPTSPGLNVHRQSPSEVVNARANGGSTPSSGGFFSGWGKRSASSTMTAPTSEGR